MPPRSELPSKIDREKFIRILQRFGFEISKKGGKGAHYKTTWPGTQKSTIVQNDLRKDVLYYLIDQIEKITEGEVTWEKIKKEI
jgi:hypothetical protein